jgi:hypothetical protein
MAIKNLRRHNFQLILATVAAPNARQLMLKAQIANRVAKSTRGRARYTAYQVKLKALASLSIRFPERVAIAGDPNLPQFVVVAMRETGYGLHAPAKDFSRRIGQ